MKKINLMLRKCKTLSRQLGRTSSYSSLRSRSSREEIWVGDIKDDEYRQTILVGSSRKQYVISSKYLNHPLLTALIEKSKQKPGENLSVKCEVVLFDHLLWMLENADPNLTADSLEELADLYSRSGSSRSPSPPSVRKSPVEGAKRGRSPPPQSKKVSPLPPPPPLPLPPPPRKASPIPESLVLRVDELTRNVNENHLREIFSNFGEVVHVQLAMDHTVNLSKGFGYVEFKMRVDAEKAQLHMDGAQIDGNVVAASFTLPEPKKVLSPPRAGAASRRDAPKMDNVVADVEKDGPKRQRECMLPTIICSEYC
ncbi:unnamed protein product [Ilex paraguariensis]|uniref:RRM domain-containing protein n=1 Tax=Ilex paraguariensis TaxID=185542 RepID=A0ABC8TZN7_9AQUA